MASRSSRSETVRTLESLGAIAVIRLDEGPKVRPVVEALAAGEVRAIEVTLTTPGALEALIELRTAFGEEIVLGAGSVLDAETARLAILEGARFVVAPTFSANVLSMCRRYDVVAVPGAYTPTEILTAWEAGADLVKVFPAGGLGPGYLKDLRAPMPQLRLVPTGGITIESAGGYIRAGAVAVGLGGALAPSDAVKRGDYGRITEQARRLTTIIREARAKEPERRSDR
jgi:2-dehydro-3-deoxyphosphogluconate aldolase/(4S)-4-hydroxy-2-oxoglutarate aldolase